MTDRASLELRAPEQPPRRVEELEGFAPAIVDRDYLEALGVEVSPTEATLAGLVRGSHALARRLREGTLVPRQRVALASIEVDRELEIHNYTGACPALTYEVSPVRGCHLGCLYCLVSDGSHEEEITVWANYPEVVARVLEQRRDEDHFFYFSPKTEAFQAPTLETGVAHEILRVFIAHFRRRPESRARLFIASKAGRRQLAAEHRGESILELLAELAPWMQFNISLSIMPESLRLLLEPHAAPVEERLAAAVLCQSRGIVATSALIQPIIPPHFTDERVTALFAELAGAGIVNFKPELLTVDPECLAILGQLIGHHDRREEKELYEAYLAPGNAGHKKQRGRIAPERGRSLAVIERMLREGERRGLSASICFWVRRSLGISEETIPLVNRNGFQCLGYQTRLFDGKTT